MLKVFQILFWLSYLHYPCCRTYPPPVEVLYIKEPESDYLDATLITVMQIHLSEPPGGILLFLTGQDSCRKNLQKDISWLLNIVAVD